jgi:hypothetical protein
MICRSLILRYADVLSERSDADAVKYWMTTGAVEKVVQFFQGMGDLRTALTTSACIANRQEEYHDHTTRRDNSPAKKNDHLNSIVESTSRDLADQLFENGDPVKAACVHLSTSQIHVYIRISTIFNEF